MFIDNNEQNWSFYDVPVCPICAYRPIEKSHNLFNSNSPHGACSTCHGFGNILKIDPNKVIPDPQKSINEGAIQPLTMPSAQGELRMLIEFCKKTGISITTPWQDLPESEKKRIWFGETDWIGIEGLFEFLESLRHKMHVRVFISRFRSSFLCPDCQGFRLRKEAYNYFFYGENWTFFMNRSIDVLFNWFQSIKLSPEDDIALKEPFLQINNRLRYLKEVGLGYLNLNREAKTLSGGEFQRIQLANQLGMELSQALYVLDEPTIGLHPRDTLNLIQIMRRINKLGNTLLVVEHDEEVIRSCDHVIEMGPGSGSDGGQVLKFWPISNH